MKLLLSLIDLLQENLLRYNGYRHKLFGCVAELGNKYRMEFHSHLKKPLIYRGQHLLLLTYIDEKRGQRIRHKFEV